MAVENITDIVISAFDPVGLNNITLPPEIIAPFSKLITILQILGIVVVAYILFIIIKGILTYNRNKKIDITYGKVLEIDKKLDLILSKKEKTEIKKSDKNPGFFARLFGFNKEKKKK